MNLPNIISWLYISVVCDLIFRWLIKGVYHYCTAIEDTPESDEPTVVKSDDIPAANSSTETTKSHTETVKEHYRSDEDSSGFRIRSIFGKKSISDLFNRGPKKESSLKDGLAKATKKVTSYFDDDGKLLYQKEKETVGTPTSKGKERQFISLDNGEKFVNPSFFIKPQPDLKDKTTFTDDISTIENKVEQTMNKMMDNTIAEAAKAKGVDDAINNTFKEINNMFPLSSPF